MKKKRFLWLFLFCLFSCNSNRIETEGSLSKSDIEYIRSLNLVGPDEKVYKFYSEFKKKKAGNFYTDKRIAKYWIDERNSDRNQLFFAFYTEIKSIDTVYNPGVTFCPHMLVTKLDGTQFKVCSDGTREEIKTFFEGALKLWIQKRKVEE